MSVRINSVLQQITAPAMALAAVLGTAPQAFGGAADLACNQTIDVPYAGVGVLQEFIVPNIPGGVLTLEVEGADGGTALASGCLDSERPGGQGSTASGTFIIGFNEGQLRPGQTIRFIIGERGEGATVNVGPLSSASAGGGGGSGVLYDDPISGEWIPLVVAGGGGGSSAGLIGIPGILNVCAGQIGDPASAGTCGTTTNNEGNAEGGCDGEGGESSNGGGGVFGNASPGEGGEAGIPDGGAGGVAISDVAVGDGGWGCGGGGAGQSAVTWFKSGGGGGGGYSGGSGTNSSGGGGGGGSFVASFAVASEITALEIAEDAGFDDFVTDITDGSGRYVLDCSPGAGNCCFPNGTAGCEDMTCQDAVCQVDPMCCSTDWDVFCVAAASALCNLCNPLPGACCLPDGSCIEVAEDGDCSAMLGTFLGEGTLCADITCGVSPFLTCDERTTFGFEGNFVRDFLIPNVPGAQLQLEAAGADGGDADALGGDGAIVQASFTIGSAPGQLQPGQLLRFITGERGDDRNFGSGAGGGGGSGVLYFDPDQGWIPLIVAGAGGGAFGGQPGLPGWTEQCGTGPEGQTSECNGGVGPGDLTGGGAFSGLNPTGGGAGIPNGGAGGISGIGGPAIGGWGLGGGGGGSSSTGSSFGIDDGGGGGGGYSGGQGGNNGPGGGGGSYAVGFATATSIEADAQGIENGMTSYLLVCQDANAGSCCVASGSPGCTNPDCADLICSVDPFCCTTQWDDDCAALALQECEVCLSQPGACCMFNPPCVEAANFFDCLFMGGAWKGPGVSCDDGECPTEGACCLPNGSCTILTAAECIGEAFGTYFGDFTLCEDFQCGPESCEGFCGGAAADGSCFCDIGCFTTNDCCEDVCAVCDFGDSCPDGKTCESCTPVGEGAFIGDAGTINENDVTSCGANDVFSSWWCYTSTCTGIASASLSGVGPGSLAFPTVAVFADCIEQQIACNVSAEVSWQAEAGTTYYIRISGEFFDNGPYAIDISCAPATGACCINGTCEALTGEDCAAQGGLYQGDFTECGDVICPLPTGACCVPSGACVTLTEDGCLSALGSYLGDGVSCANASCPQPTPIGACLLPDNICQQVTAKECAFQGGSYQGDGMSCVFEDPGSSTGACCLASGNCLLGVTEQACVENFGGVFQGADSSCPIDGCVQPELGCEGFCGGPSPDECFCDETCIITGDCCDNVCEFCPDTAGCFGPVNDECQFAIEIFDGDTDFSTINATTDGPALDGSCDKGNGLSLGADVWFNYVATETGVLTVSTCDQADYDTRLAMYQGCDCGSLVLLACNDDGPLCSDFSSLLTAAVVQGVCYKIRVGGYNSSEGSGTLSLSVATEADPTCEGFCGSQSSDGCFCDDLCFLYTDCCDGICESCPTLKECSPDFTGACCLAGGKCVMLILNECVALGGAYLGPDSDCLDADCPQPEPTCDGFCGSQTSGGCSCDSSCFAMGDCCDDICTFCPDLTGCSPACAGDLTGDGATDSADLNTVLGGFGTLYDSTDLNAVLGDFGCGT